MPGHHSRIGWALLGLVLAALLLWRLAASPPPASAHALLVRSIPEANTDLSQPPASIEMWFSEPLETGFSSARLLNSAGEEVPAGPANLDPADPTHMTLLLGRLEPGIYTVAWQTLSQTDGHEFYGSFPLTLLNPDGSRPSGVAALSEGEPRGELPLPGEVVARWLVLLGGILFLGAPLFYSLVVLAGQESTAGDNSGLVAYASDLVIKAVWLAALAVILGSWLQINLLAFRLDQSGSLPNLLLGTRTGVLVLARQALALTGLLLVLWRFPLARPANSREPRFWLEVSVYLFVLLLLLAGAAFQSETAIATLTIAGSALGLASFYWTSYDPAAAPDPLTRKVLLFLAALLLLSFSVGSHAGAAPGYIWAILGDYLHLLAVAAWLGGLVLLPLLVRRVRQTDSHLTPAALWPLVRRFSHLAAWAVFVLVVTGLFNSLVQLPNPRSLLETTYGWVLLAKLALTALVFALALLNNRLVHHRAPSPLNLAVAQRFQRQATVEAVFSLVLLVSVAVLVQTSKPVVAGAATTPPGQLFEKIVKADDLSIHFQVLPNLVGQNLFLVHLYHEDDSPIGEVQLVRLLFNYQEAQLGQAQADLEARGGNIFGLEGAFLNQAGRWDLSIYVRRRGMDDILTDISLDVPPAGSPATDAGPWQNPVPTWTGWLLNP